jgi:hypothetical protein
VRGHISDDLSTTVLPNASGVATARVPRMIGAFHGAIPTTTPAGWRIAIAVRPGTSDGITSPVTAVVWAAASDSIPDARAQLNMPKPNVLPVSFVITPAISGARSCISAAAFCKSARRSDAVVAAQAGKAAAAESAAARASSREAAAPRDATSPVHGSVRSNVSPEPAPTHDPPISSCCCSTSVMLMPRSSRCSSPARGRRGRSPRPRAAWPARR